MYLRVPMASAAAATSAVKQPAPASPQLLAKNASFAVVRNVTNVAAEQTDLEQEKSRTENKLIGNFPKREDIISDLEMNLLMIDGYVLEIGIGSIVQH